MNYDERLQKITQKKQQLDTFRPLSADEVAELEKNVRIEHVWSSAAIEGNTMSKYETAALLEGGLGATIHGKTLKETLEIIDLNDAYNYMMDLATQKQPLTTTIIRDLNRISTLETMQPKVDAGKYRAIEVWPYGSKNNPYAAPLDIPNKMDKLITWSKTAQQQLHPVQYATDLHQKFVTIHPFRDGNGRTARLLMNLALTENGYPVINVNPSPEARNQYLTALDKSHEGHTGRQVFRELIAGYVEQELDQRISILELNERNEKDAQKEHNGNLDQLLRRRKQQRRNNELER